jgi:hypothetical protein
MPSRHLSIRIAEELFDHLDAASRRSGRTRSEIAKTLIEEGLRIEQHPGIVFRAGPAGRRPGILGGPDVWEIVRVFRQVPDETADAVGWVAEQGNLRADQVRTALRYYAAYQQEIDRWIDEGEDESRRAEEAWLREQALLAG